MTAPYLRIKGWGKFQHYKDRNPPWIKLHNELLHSRTWVALDDASKALAVAIMLLASRTDNKIPADPAYIKRVAYLDTIPDLQKLVSVDFIEIIGLDENNKKVIADASAVLAKRTTETESEREKETESEQREKTNTSTAARFDDFWGEYPKKVGRKKCLAKWKSRKLDRMADTLIADVRIRKEKDSKWLEGFIPNPETYINGDRWEDALEQPKSDNAKEAARRRLFGDDAIEGQATRM